MYNTRYAFAFNLVVLMEEDGSFNCNPIVIAPPLSLSSALTFDILLPLFLIAPLTLILLGRQEKNKSRD